MTIFFTNLKRIINDKLNLIFMIVIPIVMISFIFLLISNFISVSVGVVDNDNTPFTQKVIEHLREKCHVKLLEPDEVNFEITDQSVQTVYIFEKGFTDELLKGNTPEAIQYSIQETNVATPITMRLNSFINASGTIAESVDGDEDKFYEILEDYINGKITVGYKRIENKSGELDISLTSLGFLVMSMLFLSSFAPMIMIKDKLNRTVYRVVSAPVSMKKYMLQNILSFFAVSIIQIFLLFAVLIFGFRLNFGPNPFNLIIASLVFSLVCVAMGTAVNCYSKDLRQAGLISSLVLSPMCMLGGCWWPMDFMPKTLQQIANFVPTTWIMKAYSKLLQGAGLIDIADYFLVLLVFAVVFFLLSSWRKTDIAR